MGEVRFTPSNYHKSLIFNLELQNQITKVIIQLLKPENFGPLVGLESDFPFCRIKNIQI